MTIVYSQLFSRRMESVYLQVFRLTKAEVGTMAISEYIIKLCIRLASALMVYLVMWECTSQRPREQFFDLLFIVGLIAILEAVYLVSVVLVVSLFLRHGIKELIEK